MYGCGLSVCGCGLSMCGCGLSVGGACQCVGVVCLCVGGACRCVGVVCQCVGGAWQCVGGDTSLVVRAEEQWLHLDGLADGGHPVPGGWRGGDDGIRHAGTRGGVLAGATGVGASRRAVWRGGGRRGVALAVGLVVGAEGAVGGGQGGALALGTDHSCGPLQAERLQLLTRTVGEAVGDLGLWPDLQHTMRRKHLSDLQSLPVRPAVTSCHTDTSPQIQLNT